MKVHSQSAFDKWPFEDSSMQAIITSPPYWGLRKYDIPDVVIGVADPQDCEHEFIEHSRYWDNRAASLMNSEGTADFAGKKDARGHIKTAYCNCGAWKGQYGLEPSYKDYIEHTVLWAKEAWRVLRDDGVFFLNIGDSYSGMKMGNTNNNQKDGVNRNDFKKEKQDLQSKCKMLIPHRIAIALIDDGWTLRNDIIWHKPNGMPESCQDRFSKKFEYIFMLVKNEKYYFDLDGIREKHMQTSIERLGRAVGNNNKWVKGADGQTKHGLSQPRHHHKDRVGTMQSTEFGGGDYMVGKLNPLGKNPGDMWSINTQPSSEKHFAMWPEKLVERMILCSTKQGDAILDPFAGSGTTLRVAEQHNRVSYGIDLGYSDIQARRLDNIQKRLL